MMINTEINLTDQNVFNSCIILQDCRLSADLCEIFVIILKSFQTTLLRCPSSPEGTTKRSCHRHVPIYCKLPPKKTQPS